MTGVTIRTTRYKFDDSNTLFVDYVIRKNNEGSMDVNVITTKVDTRKLTDKLETYTTQDQKTYPNSRRCIQDVLGDIEEYDYYDYCEVEIRSFAHNKRVDKEFKIKLKESSAGGQFANIKRFFDLFFNPEKQIESLRMGEHTIDIEINDKQLLSIDLDKKYQQIKEMAERVEETLSIAQDLGHDTDLDSIITEGGTRKKRGFLKKLFRKK